MDPKIRPNAGGIPAELKTRPQWVTWRWEKRRTRDGDKWTKPPRNPVTGDLARVDTPQTWADFPRAVEYARKAKCDGVGYVVTADDPYCGVDLDHCRNPESGQIDDWATEIVTALDSYTELTPSGTGVRVWVKATLPEKGRRKGRVEIYDRERFFTLTGVPLTGTPTAIQERQAAIDALLGTLFTEPVPAPTATSNGRDGLELSDETLVQKAKAAQNGARFARLWAGDWTGYQSQSEADLALCCDLAFWTGKDAHRMDALFRRSGLMRLKWDERHGRETYGQTTIAKAIARTVQTYTSHGTAQNGTGEKPAPSYTLVRLADVQAEKVRWLWPARIVLGKLNLLDGDPGLGKSAVTLDIAARVTCGASWPDGTRSDLDGPADVILLSAEDGLADTIRPRLDAAGADITRVHVLTLVQKAEGDDLPTLPRDLQELEDAINRTQARLVVVDPLMAYLADDVNAKQDHDVRRALRPLSALAEATGAAILVVRHLNKATGGNALYRGGGSIAFTGTARSSLLIAPDPHDDTGTRRILATIKCNLAPKPRALAYHPEAGPGDVVRIVWDGESEHTADSLLSPVEEDDAQDRALTETEQFLIDALTGGPQLAKDVRQQARIAGIADRTLDRAKAKLGIESFRLNPNDWRSSWLWKLPSGESRERST